MSFNITDIQVQRDFTNIGNTSVAGTILSYTYFQDCLVWHERFFTIYGGAYIPSSVLHVAFQILEHVQAVILQIIWAWKTKENPLM